MSLVWCPECGRRFSEQAEKCPRCSLPITDPLRAELRASATTRTRIGLGVLGVVLIVISSPCLILQFAAPDRERLSPQPVSRQEQAYQKLQGGERLSDTDVHDLAWGARDYPRQPNPEDDFGLLLLISLVLLLSGVGILWGLLLSCVGARSEAKGADVTVVAARSRTVSRAPPKAQGPKRSFLSRLRKQWILWRDKREAALTLRRNGYKLSNIDNHPDNGKHGYWLVDGRFFVYASTAGEAVMKVREQLNTETPTVRFRGDKAS